MCACVNLSTVIWFTLTRQQDRDQKKSIFFFHSLSGSLLLCVLQAELGWLNRTNPSEGWHPQRIDFKALLICFNWNIKMLWEKQKYSKAVFSWQLIAHMSLFLVLVCVSSSSHCFLLNGKRTLGLSEFFFLQKSLFFFTFKWNRQLELKVKIPLIVPPCMWILFSAFDRDNVSKWSQNPTA